MFHARVARAATGMLLDQIRRQIEHGLPRHAILSTAVGDLEMDDVRLRIAAPPSGMDPDTHHCLYEFIAEEIVPTDGRPYQVSVLPSGGTETLFGARVTHV